MNLAVNDVCLLTFSRHYSAMTGSCWSTLLTMSQLMMMMMMMCVY